MSQQDPGINREGFDPYLHPNHAINVLKESIGQRMTRSVSVSRVDSCVVVCWYWVVGCFVVVVVVRRFVSFRFRPAP
ncbi:MAG: hypothetical protein HONDAALG_00511 [Gammaproteobacteria bacterium]|nr:hypothetical protein [Gammaproteobacteria bacterium]